MIPKNIKREHIIKATEEAKRVGVPKGRSSKKFLLEYNCEHYPPKYIISLANKYANTRELLPSEFGGGKETNDFLRALGFNIIVEVSTLKKTIPKSPKKHKEMNLSRIHHDERCPKCKETIRKLLEKIYGKVEQNYKFEVETHPEDFIGTPYYDKLKKIYETLQNHRGYKDFVRSKKLDNVDYFVPEPGFIVEFDESQHFTELRRIALRHYPDNFQLGFDKEKWIKICKETDAKDNVPLYRDEQRAWYDTLRDFLPEFKGLEPTIRLYSKETQWCSLDPKNPRDIVKFREIIENRQRKLSSWVATVILQSNGRYSNEERLNILSQIVDLVAKKTVGNGVILFPGGWFSAGKEETRSLYKWVEENVKNILNINERNIVVCIGIDGRIDQYPRDQIGIAVSKKGIEAIGRKFQQAPQEKGHVELAKDHLSKEDGKSRVFELNGRKHFLCACYDSFGIRKKGISNFGIDIILDLVHSFYKPGKGPSGVFYFARDGFAGASKHWACPVFGAVVFFDRDPKNWSSGVYWNQGDKDIKKWRYADNPIKPKVTFELNIEEGVASVKIYNLEMM